MTATLPPLTERQQEVLTAIRFLDAQKGYPPSVREIGARLGILSPNGVIGHLTALEQKGYITRDPAMARGIRLTAIEKRRCPHCRKEID